jgi:alkanesulfonate monooxygenase SsuD/methylene tetrahydromethanopterin reductase-like flavin-dependent oxidoreductase (luciferase family)
VEIGVCLPYMERDHPRELVRAWCQRLDQGPFSSLSCGERITGYTYEMRTMLAAAAAWTERIRIMPSLYVLPMHSAVWAAKEVATLDVLSGGRTALCVGIGGRADDYRAVGASFAHRHARLDDQVAEMRRIWAGAAPFEGADEVGPRPLQDGGPPLFAGAMGPKAIRRAAAWADGIYAWSGDGDAEEIARIAELAEACWEEAGRGDPPRRLAGFWYSLAPDAGERLQRYVYEYLKVFGSARARVVAKTMSRSRPDAVRAALDALEDLGCDEVILVPATRDLAEIDGACEVLAARG